jgi:AraC family transcriptional regulator
MHGGPEARSLPEHEHREAQIEVHFRANENSVAPVDTELIPPGRPHVGGWEAGSEVIVMLIPPAAFERVADEILVRSKFNVLDQRIASEPLVQQLALSLRNQFRSSAGLSKLSVESCGYVLAEHILRHYAETAPLRDRRDRMGKQRLIELVNFIDHNLEHEITVGRMASAMGMGVHRLTYALKRALGCTPHQLVQRRRIELAKAMLKQDHYSLAQIALRLGFATQSHFTTVFHKATGVTPNVYRQRR